MSKISMISALAGLAMTSAAMAQFTFPTITGPLVVTNPTTLNTQINDAGNSAGVTAGLYSSATISVAWAAIANDPWSNEAGAGVNGSPIVGATTGAAGNGASTTLTFNTGLNGIYNPSVNGSLTLNFLQAFSASSASWSNISVTLNPFIVPAAPSAINLGGISGALLTFNTTGSAIAPDNDTEIGVFDSNGFLLGTNDDISFPSNALSSLDLAGLANGTYFIAVGAFNTSYGNGFVATSTSALTGTTVVNVTNGTDTLTGGGALAAGQIQWYSITVPTPGAAALLGLGGLMAARRRRA